MVARRRTRRSRRGGQRRLTRAAAKKQKEENNIKFKQEEANRKIYDMLIEHKKSIKAALEDNAGNLLEEDGAPFKAYLDIFDDIYNIEDVDRIADMPENIKVLAKQSIIEWHANPRDRHFPESIIQIINMLLAKIPVG